MPTAKNKNTTQKEITYFVARIGGWDGIAIQAELWIETFLSLGYKIHLVTGEIDESPGKLSSYPYDQIQITCIPQLKLDYQRKFFDSAQKDKYHRSTWLPRFLKDKESIKEQFNNLIKSSNKIFLHNFSIKHLIPSAWAAMYELIIENKSKQFISLDADSPYERPQILEDLAPDFIRILGDTCTWYKRSEVQIKNELKEYTKKHNPILPGPDMVKNLHHIFLNSYQERVAKNIYGIPKDQITTIPDLGRFSIDLQAEKNQKPNLENFFTYLTKNQLTNPQKTLDDKNYVYILSPVRPIARKKIHEVAYMAKLFEKYLQSTKNPKKVVLVVTHPNIDSPDYFKKILRYTKQINLTFIHLGDNLQLRKKEKDTKIFTYHEVMCNFGHCHSISIVASEFGGWENGILESTEYGIPVSANPLLPSFQDMTAFGFHYIPAPVLVFSDLRITEFSVKYLAFPSINNYYCKLYDLLFSKKIRMETVKHNFQIGKSVQSKNTAKKIIKSIMY